MTATEINQNKSHSQGKQNKIKENPALKEQKHEGGSLTLWPLPLQIYSVICVLRQCGILATISNQHWCTPVTWRLHGSTVSLARPFSFSSQHGITLGFLWAVLIPQGLILWGWNAHHVGKLPCAPKAC